MVAGLSNIFNIANSALATNQTALSVVSDNISNVNTAGYVTKVINQRSLSTTGQGSGVTIASITRAANQYLQQASLTATANSGKYGAVANNLGSAQTLFGDPSGTNSLFSQLDKVFSAFSALSAAPSSVQQSQSIAAVSTFFSQVKQVSQGLANIQTQTDQQITTDVSTVNSLLSQIDSLNTDISRGSVAGADVTGYQNQQSQYIDQLSKLIDIKVSPGTVGGAGVTIRGGDGSALTGVGRGPAVFSYDTSNGSGQILFTPPGGVNQPYGTRLGSGEIEGLLQSRNTSIPNISQQLGEFASGAATALNKASNAYSAVPAPSSLTGKDTGIDIPSTISNPSATPPTTGFTGKTNIAILNSAGVVQSSVAIDFNAGTVTAGGTTTSFTPSTFVSVLNTALSPGGGASVNGNVLSLTASGGNGVAVVDDPTTPSQLAGKGFSQYFGLNDVVSSAGISDFNTGLTANSLSGFNSGTVKFRISGQDGAAISDISVTPASGATLGAVVTQLNSTSSGLGLYGAFSLDSKGAITFTPRAGSNLSLSVVTDTTARNGTGPSLTQLFGLDPSIRSGRADGFSVNPLLAQTPSLLPNAKVNLSATPPAAAIAAGDTRGTDALAQAGRTLASFQSAGSAPAATSSLTDYSASFSARIGSSAAQATSAKDQADSTVTEANQRRTATEGVNLDEELIKLTTYQQAYNASARLINAAKDMYDALLQVVT